MIDFDDQISELAPCWKLMPGGTTVVALYSVTTAGPEYFFPAGSESRERIAAVSLFPEKNTGRGLQDPAGLCPAGTGEGARPHVAWGGSLGHTG